MANCQFCGAVMPVPPTHICLACRRNASGEVVVERERRSRLRWASDHPLVATALLLAALIGLALLVILPPEEKVSPEESARYRVIRAECIDYADALFANDPVYVVGGRRWAETVNRCMLEKAVDQDG